MNYFALAVVVLQVLAALQYIHQKLYWEAALWLSYGVGNVILIILAEKRLPC